MTLGKYAHIVLAGCLSLMLILVTAVSVNVIYEHDRTNISHHIMTRLQATSGLLELWQHDYLMSVRSIAEDPILVNLVDKLVSNKITTDEASATLDQWLRPIYLGRGYEGHSIINPEFRVLLASSPAFNGKPVSSPESREVIGKALNGGTGVGRPAEAAYQVRMLDRMADAGTLFQLGCARISKNGKVLGALCLRQDPYRTFFAMLGTGFSGTSGEAYGVDRKGFIVSPTRFGNSIIRNGTPQIGPASFVKGLQARVPSKTKTGILIDAKASPLTETVATALEKTQNGISGESGFIDGYADYRGKRVVGAAKWLPEMDLGVVIEQDMDEVYAPYRFSRNAIVGLAGLAIILVNTLIIVQVRSRQSLAEREQRMRAFLDNFPGLAHMRDSKGQFLIANRHMEEFFHLDRKDIIGHTHDSLPLPRKYITTLNLDHEEVLRTGNLVEDVRDVSDLDYGDTKWLKTIRFPVVDAQTQEIYAVGTILLDITEQTRNAQELDAIRINLEHRVAERTVQFEAAKREAEQAAQAKADFLANMSHEIRTPMNAIIGLSHLATLVSDDPKLRSYLQRIHQSGSHLLSIINDILDFSKIEAGKMTLEPTDFALEDMLNNVVGLLWEKAESKGLELLLQIDTDIPGNLNGDALRIGQVLINFTSNAVKFTESGDVVLRVRKIRENAHSVRVRFEVQDTGIGIPPERFHQLFKPFHQLDTSSTRRFEGTGLGLTISKNLVELMEGQLDIQSKPGVGSTFSLELTLAKSSTPHLVEYRNISLRECRVLVVDDNQHAREILAYMLRALSLDVSEADSGSVALEHIEQQDARGSPFEIVFLDWKMPRLSGIETAERISKQTLSATPKLVLVSTHAQQDISADNEHLLGAILTKPVTPSALYDTVTSLLKNSCVKTEKNTALDIQHYKTLANTRVLLVDDNDINQDVVKELLNLVNATVVTATNGQEALDYLDDNLFDIVLMDVQMPVMDGLAATRAIRKRNNLSQLPVIAMTANARSSDRDNCLNAGMSDYISKPIDPEILFDTLLRWHHNQADELKAVPTTDLSEQKHQGILKNLHAVPELDVTAALGRLLNNEIFYIKLIQRFINERKDFPNELEQEIHTGKTETAARLAHTFKSLAGTVGATELEQLSAQIETALQENTPTENVILELRKSLSTLLVKIHNIFASAEI